MLHAVVSVLATAGQCPSLSFCLATLRPLPLSPPPPPSLSPPPPARRPFPSQSDDQLSARKRRRTAGKSLLKVMQPTALVGSSDGTPTKRQVSKRQVSKRPVSKRLKRQVYKTLGLQNVRFTKCQVYKRSGLQNVQLQKSIHIYSVLVIGGNQQVLLQPCLQAK
jgi:hypothetical protein